MRSRKRKLVFVVTIGLGLLALAICLIVPTPQKPYQDLDAGLRELALGLEHYAVDRHGEYPPDLRTLVSQGYLEAMPQNPFASGEMPILQPGDAWQPGGVVYVPLYPTISGLVSAPDSRLINPQQADNFMLLAYSPRPHPARAIEYRKVRRDYEKALASLAQGKLPQSIPYYAEGIDWLHMEKMLTAGEVFPRLVVD